MTTYTVEANTGSSMWPVASFETSPEVEQYLRTETAYGLHVSSGNSGMYLAPRAADVLVQLLAAQASVQPGDRPLHDQAIHEVARLVQLAATHHGAQINWEQTSA